MIGYNEGDRKEGNKIMQKEATPMFDRIENATIRVISLGAGGQSSVMSLMAARGELEMPDAAIFADTQWEPKEVYDHLNWLEEQLPFPVYRVTHGDIRKMSLETVEEAVYRPSIPLYVASPQKSMAPRQCTANFKIKPIQKKVRELIGLEKGAHVPKTTVVENWMGITRDEIYRVKPSRIKWMPSRWPLIEKNMTRHDCNLWWDQNYPGRPPLPKSACIGCPFKGDHQWREMRDNDPDGWNDLVDFDHSLRDGKRHAFGMKFPTYIHSSHQPMDEVDLSTEQDHGQLDMFGEECEGMCGI